MVPWLASDDPFPPVERALGESSGAPGLLAASAELQSSRLVDAYQHGIFPWYSDGQPVLWWSPDPRMVLIPDEFKVSDSLEEALYSGEVKQRRAIITKFMNWKRFDYFLEKFKVEMTGADGKSWANVRSPFGTRDASNGLVL